MSIELKHKKQQGSFFAEIGAVIASIAILTLVSTSYMDSMAGRAQVAEAFVLMNPIVENVNSFYAFHGTIDNNPTNGEGNYDEIDVYDNAATGDNPNNFAGRFVETVTSFDNGVVMARMNEQHSDALYTNQYVGKVSNVQTAIQGEYIFLVPFLVGDSKGNDINPSEQTYLRWACLTTIDANPPTGEVIAPLDDTSTINEQYFYAPGCVVITITQANCLKPTGRLNSADTSTTCSVNNIFNGPVNWNETLYSLVD